MTTALAEPLEVIPEANRLRDAFALVRGNKLALLGGVVTLVFVCVGAAGAVVVLVPSLQHVYLDQNLVDTLRPPLTRGHLHGQLRP
jgi:hypothetical protein